MGFGFLGGFRVNLHRGADVLVSHDVLNDLQVGLIFAQPGAERVPEIMAGEGRQQLRLPLFLFGLFQFGFVVCHADALDGAVDRLRVLRLAEAVQEYEVRDSVDLVFAHQFQFLLVGALLLQCLPHFGQDRNCPLACGSFGCGHGEIAAAHLVVMVHQIVLDGDKPTLEVDVTPAQANRFRDAASGTQHEGEHREPVLELRRFLDEIQKCLLLGLCFIDPRCLRHTPARLTCGRSEYDPLPRIELPVHLYHRFQNRGLAGAGAACDDGQVMPEHHLHAF